MKNKVYENEAVTKDLKENALHLCNCANKVVNTFHECQPFDKIVTNEQASALVLNPIEYFDQVMIKGAGVKPVKGLKVEPEAVALMYGVNRSGFIAGIQVETRGSRGHFASFKLRESLKYLLLFQDGMFIVNETELQKDIEAQKTYAETPEQIEILEYWENLANVLNKHLDKKYITEFEIYQLAQTLGLKNVNKRFTPNYQSLASIIKSMVLVN